MADRVTKVAGIERLKLGVPICVVNGEHRKPMPVTDGALVIKAWVCGDCGEDLTDLVQTTRVGRDRGAVEERARMCLDAKNVWQDRAVALLALAKAYAMEQGDFEAQTPTGDALAALDAAHPDWREWTP